MPTPLDTQQKAFLDALHTLNGANPEGYILADIRDEMSPPGSNSIRLLDVAVVRDELCHKGLVEKTGHSQLHHLLTKAGRKELAAAKLAAANL